MFCANAPSPFAVPGFAKQPLFKKDRDGTATGKKSRLDLRKGAWPRETNLRGFALPRDVGEGFTSSTLTPPSAFSPAHIAKFAAILARFHAAPERMNLTDYQAKYFSIRTDQTQPFRQHRRNWPVRSPARKLISILTKLTRLFLLSARPCRRARCSQMRSSRCVDYFLKGREKPPQAN